MLKKALLYVTLIISPHFVLGLDIIKAIEGLEEEAKLAAQINNFDRAVTLYSSSLKIKPNRIESLEGRGYCYQELGKYDSAKTDFIKIITLDTAYSNGYYLLGNLEKLGRNYKLAIEYFETAVRIQPKWEYYLGAWQAYVDWNKKEEGVVAVDALINTTNRDPKTNFNFAVLLLRQDIFKQAIGQFISGIKKGGSSYQFHVNKDYKYVDIKFNDKEFVKFVIENGMATTQRDANYYLARIYSLLDNQEKAIELLTALRNEDARDLIVYQDLGYCFLLSKKYRKAKGIFTDCIEKYQENDNVYCNRGITHLETGDLDLALADFNASIGLRSSNGWAYFYRGITNARMNKMGAAYSDFATARKIGGLLPSQENDISAILYKDFVKRGW